MVVFPNAMDASKQISTISLGKWVTFRKLALTNEAYQSKIEFFLATDEIREIMNVFS